jgi:hypothetical protein
VTYAQVDDNFAEHPKVAARSDAAFRVQVRGICYANRLLTDGFVPASVAEPWGRRAVRELVDADMWAEASGGYVIHDFLDWNDSAEEVRSRRDSKRIAGAIGAATRWGDSNSLADGVERSGEGSRFRGGGLGEGFADFWRTYPRKVGKRTAQGAYLLAVGRSSIAEIQAGAECYRDDPNREDAFTAHPSTWLNRDGWADDALPARNGKADHITAQAKRLLGEGVTRDQRAREPDGAPRSLPEPAGS